jgi:non-specific serine/threonine protein kinase
VDRAWLAGTIWPESPQRQAAYNLRRGLSDLRRALGDEADRIRSPSARSLILDLCDAEVDLVAFDQAIARGDTSSLEAAVALYRGPLLEGCAEEWALQERREREEAYLQALQTLAAQAKARGEPGEAARYLRGAVAVDPLRESAQRGLMEALAAAGEYAAAVQTYRDLRLLLHRELNAEPDPRSTTLFEQIRAAARQRVVRPPVAVPAAASSPGRIPHPVSSLIGREREVEEVLARLGTARLLTLTGTGGVGKTRLAIMAAQETAEHYPDGAWFVDLSSLWDEGLVPQAVASTLELREEPGRGIIDTLLDFLAPKSLLLALDNCEHLLGACALLAEQLLGRCPHLRILCTSRQSLGITGEVAWRVPSLTVPSESERSRNGAGARLAPHTLHQYEATRLFVERAAAVLPSFRVTDRNAPVIAHVCYRLDGIPLAIELATARVRALAVEEIAERLDDRFHFLTAGSRTALPRHQTLRATFDWSYDRLDEAEKALLCRLSVFSGGWTLEAAEQICAGDSYQPGCVLAAGDVLDVLISLVEKSLVVAEPRHDGTRYRLLETVHQYARDRLAERGWTALFQDRHLQFYRAFLERATMHLVTAQQLTWIEHLEADHDNVRSALARSMMSEGSSESGLRLCSALWRFWGVRGYFAEGRKWCELALERAAPGDAHARASVLNAVGNLAFYQGDYGAASLFHEESLALNRELQYRKGVAGALNNLGNVAYETGDYLTARSRYEESLTLFRALEERLGICNSLNGVGKIALLRGDCVMARTAFEEILTLSRQAGDREGIGIALNNLAWASIEQGDFGAARAMLADAVKTWRDLGHRHCLAFALENLAELGLAESDPARAARLYGAAEWLREEIGSPLPPNQRPSYEQHVGAARAAIDDDGAFAAAWHEGRMMPLEQAIAYALEEGDD